MKNKIKSILVLLLICYFVTADLAMMGSMVWATGRWTVKSIRSGDSSTVEEPADGDADAGVESEIRGEEESRDGSAEASGAGSEAEASAAGSETEEPEEKLDESIPAEERIMSRMTMEEKVYQLFIVELSQIGIEASAADPTQIAGALEEYPVGGIIFFEEDIQTPEQTKRLVDGIQMAADSNCQNRLFLSVDEEGGKVTRIAQNAAFRQDEALKVKEFPPMKQLASTEEAQKVAKNIAGYLKRIGFNLNFAPVADVWSNPDNTVIGERSYSSQPDSVKDFVSISVKAYNKQKILSTIKHFPGHGDTAGDSHKEIVFVNKTLKEMQACELIPFQEGISH